MRIYEYLMSSNARIVFKSVYFYVFFCHTAIVYSAVDRLGLIVSKYVSPKDSYLTFQNESRGML